MGALVERIWLGGGAARGRGRLRRLEIDWSLQGLGLGAQKEA